MFQQLGDKPPQVKTTKMNISIIKKVRKAKRITGVFLATLWNDYEIAYSELCLYGRLVMIERGYKPEQIKKVLRAFYVKIEKA